MAEEAVEVAALEAVEVAALEAVQVAVEAVQVVALEVAVLAVRSSRRASAEEAFSKLVTANSNTVGRRFSRTSRRDFTSKRNQGGGKNQEGKRG